MPREGNVSEKKICPIMPFEAEFVLGVPVHEPRKCLRERCAWWAYDRCFVAGAALAAAALSEALHILGRDGLNVRRAQVNQDGA